MSAIELKNVSLSFPKNIENRSTSLRSTIIKSITRNRTDNFKKNNDHHYALKDISLEIGTGRKVGIIGANGAGKTTLLKVISEIYEPTSGSISVNGKISSFLSLGLGSHPEYTGIESIRNQLLLLGYSKKEIDKALPSIISFSELDDFINAPIKQYSAGMQMRLNFAIMAEVNPEIVVMDEWLSTGDLYFIEKAQKKISDIVNKAHILILGSHDLALLENICTDIIFMDKGQILHHGQPKETIEIYKQHTLKKRSIQ